jgi:AcrR family transcriptional regulator
MQEGLRQRMKRETQQVLYETALDLFRTNGFEKTTIAEVARLAGVAKGTFFNYFESKDAVLALYYERLTRDSLKLAIQKKHPDARSAVHNLFGNLAKRGETDTALFYVLGQIKLASSALKREEQHLDKEIFSFVSGYVQQDIGSGQLSVDLDASTFTEMLLVILTGTSHEWRLSENRLPLRKTVKIRVDYLFDLVEKKNISETDK